MGSDPTDPSPQRVATQSDPSTEPAATPSAEGPDARTAQLAELGLMTASLLHELRDPVFALRARLQLLAASGEVPADAVSGLQASIDDIEALVAFYGGLGRSGLQTLPVDVGSEVQAAESVLQARARRQRTALRIEAQTGLLVVVRPVTVRQVLTNLTNNALDAVADRAGAEVRVWARRDGDDVLLGVDDDGPGWGGDPEGLAAPWVSTKGEQGSGLGLYLTKRLLTEASGRLELSETPDGGARAVARWPRA